MVKKIVITGASSAIGIAIIEECIKNNIDVLAITNPNSNNKVRIPKSCRVKIIECDLDDMKEIKVHDDTYEAFIHLAWAATSGNAARNQTVEHTMNIKYALDAVDLAYRLGCTVFLGAGSQAEYGRTTEIMTEQLETHPETAYAIAKLCAGQMTRLYCRQKKIRHIWPRILSAYGPYCKPNSVINYTISELLAGREPALSGCEQIWDFIYVGDVARAYLTLAEKGSDGEIYVIGSGESRQLKDYIYEIQQAINSEIKLGIGARPYSMNEVMHLQCDIGKLRNEVGFIPLISFAEGIKRTIEWTKEH